MSTWQAFTADLAREVERALEEVRSHLRGAEEVQAFRPSDQAWSNLEIGEHVMLVNRYLLVLVDKIALKSRACHLRGERPDERPSRLDHLQKLAARDFEWTSPVHMLPSGRYTASEIDALLGEQIRHCSVLIAALPAGEGTLHRIRMSVVEEEDRLDLYQFMCVLGLHTRRHARAMERNTLAFERARAH
jgi:hypothetical protein